MFVNGRGVEHDAHPPPGRLLHDIGQAVDLVLQDEIVPGLKVLQRPVCLLMGDLLIAAAKKQNAVLPGGIHLNDGMAAGTIADGHEGGVHAAVPQGIRQNGSVTADPSGMTDRASGAGGGDGLIEPLAAAVDGAAGRAQGLPRLHKMGHLIDKVQIQRAIAENACHMLLLMPASSGR